MKALLLAGCAVTILSGCSNTSDMRGRVPARSEVIVGAPAKVMDCALNRLAAQERFFAFRPLSQTPSGGTIEAQVAGLDVGTGVMFHLDFTPSSNGTLVVLRSRRDLFGTEEAPKSIWPLIRSCAKAQQ